MGLTDVFNRWKHRNEVFKELQDDDRASEKVQERKLSANERELNKILKAKREDQIKTQLDKHHKQELHTFWHKDVISQKNIFANNKNIFVGNKRLF